MGEVKSRFEFLYPPHRCQICQLEHVIIPTIVVEQEFDGDIAKIPLVPWEIVNMTGGTAHPGHDFPKFDFPTHIRILFWGPPGTDAATQPRFLFMN